MEKKKTTIKIYCLGGGYGKSYWSRVKIIRAFALLFTSVVSSKYSCMDVCGVIMLELQSRSSRVIGLCIKQHNAGKKAKRVKDKAWP